MKGKIVSMKKAILFVTFLGIAAGCSNSDHYAHSYDRTSWYHINYGRVADGDPRLRIAAKSCLSDAQYQKRASLRNYTTAGEILDSTKVCLKRKGWYVKKR